MNGNVEINNLFIYEMFVSIKSLCHSSFTYQDFILNFIVIVGVLTLDWVQCLSFISCSCSCSSLLILISILWLKDKTNMT